jgi:glyoxylase-like metal-dependent hydrolase (beta-lactamase superfamily II)
MMENGAWQKIPGAADAEIYPICRKPDLFTSNSWLIRTDDTLVLIDPGGRADQFDAVRELVNGQMNAGQRRLLVLITHCHIDHVLNCAAFILAFPSARVAAHKEGARLLAAGDADVTQALLLGAPAPAFACDTILSASEEREHRIRIGAADELRVFHTPGHSPDSVCCQIGRLLVVGDLPFAAGPLVAGIAGWDQPALVRSFQRMMKLIDDERIECCLPGHGKPLPADSARRLFGELAKEAGGLDGIRLFDRQRAELGGRLAANRIDELNDLFTIIAGRLFRLAYHLEELEEAQSAAQFMDAGHAEEIEQILAGCNKAVDGFRQGAVTALHMAQVAVHSIRKIMALWPFEQLRVVIDAPLLRQTARLLSDFMQIAKGLSFNEPFEQIDLNGFLAAAVQDVVRSRHDEPDVMELAADADNYLAALVQRIANQPVFKNVGVTFVPWKEPLFANIAIARFRDALSALLADLAAVGVKQIALALCDADNEPAIEIRCAGEACRTQLGERRFATHRDSFALAGAELVCHADQVPGTLVLIIPRALSTTY